MGFQTDEKQVVSKRRVVDHGEVYTGAREVNAMLDLVRQETERIDSRFLEPACGTGNFLTEILARKLRVVESRYRRSQLEYERYAALAVSSVYGIDILEDNVLRCRERLFAVFDENYSRLYRRKTKDACQEAIRYILGRNIIWGDALTLKTVDSDPKPIVFSEWSPVNGNLLKRRDFTFRELLTRAEMRDMPLYAAAERDVFIPVHDKEYPPVPFLRLAEANDE